jgi:hypothetical protein
MFINYFILFLFKFHRFATKYQLNDTDYRILYKAYGIRFVISVSGTGGRFNIVLMMMSIGSGAGLMSISVIVADVVMLYFTKERKLFLKMKDIDVDRARKLIEKSENLIASQRF